MELKAGQKNMANEPMYKKIYEDLLDGIKVGTAVSFVSPEKVLLSYLRAIWKRHCRMKIL